MKTLAETRDLGFARVRERSRLGFVYIRVGEYGYDKGEEKGIKNPNLAQNRPAVPAPVSAVLVPNGHCQFLHKWYRYR